MRSIPTSVLCNFWLFFAGLGFVYLLLIIGLQIPFIKKEPVFVISSIITFSLLMSVFIFQQLGLYLICKRGVPKEEGFDRQRRQIYH